MEFEDVVRARRSTRSFLDKDVEEEKIQRMLEAARLAPSARNGQCWSFVVVRDQAIKEKISGGLINTFIKTAPVVIAACANPKASAKHGDIELYLIDMGIATEHLVLAATNEGLGTCWIGAFDESRVKGALGIPDGVRVVALIPVGYPKEKEELKTRLTRSLVKADQRKPLQDIVHYEKW